MVMVFLQASFAGNKNFKQRRCWCQTNFENTCLKDILKKLRSDQIGCWSVSTSAQADVTGHKGGDGFLRGVRASDGFLHLLFFLRENPR